MSVAVVDVIATLAMLLIFAAAFLVARRIGNYSIVDVVWSYAFGVITLWYAVAGKGWLPRRAGIGFLVIAWSGRLGTHLLKRLRAHHPAEDGRYVTMRREWGEHFGGRMFRFYLIQGASVVVLATPFLVTTGNARVGLAPLELLGLLVCVVGVTGESVTDAQLARFRRNRSPARRVCEVGLWHYSRHPNYFFEWTIWMGFWLIACAAGTWGVATFTSPLIMLYLLLHVSGVPLAEAQSLRSRGEVYRRYQQTTSVFIPLPPQAWRAHLPAHDAVDG